ncbi:hypothetical protein [Nocardioides caldifontis]|uniref:hypothetical protein n=1 Tax=Nocardioides caldifontis TaxID=2588938 RepID=UPI0011DFC89F|nr:hypothetical protein [Nocardioides caldifontis]
MTALAATPTTGTTDRPWGRIVCAATAVGTFVPFAMLEITGDSGAEMTAGLVDDVTLLMSGSMVAVLVAAGLFVAAARLGKAVGGEPGILVTATGSAVALMFAGFYAVFGAGGVVAAEVMAEPGPGVGEATSVLLNTMEIMRYAPGLALTAVVLLAGARFPRWVRGTAAFLVLLTLVPFTSWVAALLIPLWLPAVAAKVRA